MPTCCHYAPLRHNIGEDIFSVNWEVNPEYLKVQCRETKSEFAIILCIHHTVDRVFGLHIILEIMH